MGEAGVPPERGATQPLKGLEPAAFGHNPQIESVAVSYAKASNIPYARQHRYVEIDEEISKRIADAYEAMPHDPNDPAVKAAYKAMAEETIEQYKAIVASGYNLEMMREGVGPPYRRPRGALQDLQNNKHLWVYPTRWAYGAGEAKLDPASNPLLAPSGLTDSHGTPMLINDVFRAVHDFFGHGIEGTGFRARGEENAWLAHSRLYSEAALPAVTTETRGQNSWVNFGPRAAENLKSSPEDTVYADQKIGLLPSWVWEDSAWLAADYHGRGLHSSVPTTEWKPDRPDLNLNPPGWSSDVIVQAESILSRWNTLDPYKKISAIEDKDELKKLGIAVDLRRVLDGFVEAFRLDEEGLPRGHPYDLGV